MDYSTQRSRIPAFDLVRQHQELGEQLQRAAGEVIASGRMVLGPHVEALEAELAALVGVSAGVGVASGTDALYLALLALGVGPGDEVITSPFTFAATATAIARAGAEVRFADIDPATYNLDAEDVARRLTPRTRALIPVHLYGHPAPMGPLMELARARQLLVVEDCAQAIGATWEGRPAGSFGDAAILSFYPTKNLGGCGDGGMVLTSDPEVADRVRMLRVHASRVRYHHERADGINSRLDEIQAAMLRVKLPHLERWNRRRRAIAEAYRRGLAPTPLRMPPEQPGAVGVYHQFTVACQAAAPGGPLERDQLRAHLEARGIESQVYYPLPLHLQPAFASLGYSRGSFPAAEAASDRVLSLPMFPELTEEEVERVCQAVREFYGR